MTEYLPYIFGTVSLFVGVYLFLVSFKIYKPKYNDEQRMQRSINWHKKFGTISKIASIAMILNGSYDLIANNPDRYRIGQITRTEWRTSDREILINTCIRDAGQTAIDYPKISKVYCECSMDKIISAMTYKEYIQLLDESIEDQANKIIPIIAECTNMLNEGIKERVLHVYFTDTLQNKYSYQLNVLEENGLIKYTYSHETEKKKNMTFVLDTTNQILRFSGDDFIIKNDDVLYAPQLKGYFFNFYSNTSGATDATDPIFFNKEYGVLGIGNSNAPNFIYLTEDDSSTSRFLNDKL